MAETTVQQPAAQTEAAALAEIDFYCKETDRLLAEMKQMQMSIDRLHATNGARLTEIEAALDRMAAQ